MTLNISNDVSKRFTDKLFDIYMFNYWGIGGKHKQIVKHKK